MDSKLEQAKEWASRITAERARALNTPLNEKAFAAAEVIQSLPDTVVDGDKLREVINKVLANTIHGTVGHQVAEDYAALIGELIPAPSLPTLAELIEAGNDPQKYQWMQCTVEDRGDDTFVIVMVREDVTKVLHPDGMHEVKRNSQVTPLPDLPKLEWPGSHADTITAESVEDVQAGRVADFEPALPRPEDVPAGEAWLIVYEGGFHTALKAGASYDSEPWIVHLKGEDDYSWLRENEVTLISRLVPERKENA